jgi:hypothetical protein
MNSFISRPALEIPLESAWPLKKALFTQEFLDGHVGHIVYNPHSTGLDKLFQLQ